MAVYRTNFDTFIFIAHRHIIVTPNILIVCPVYLCKHDIYEKALSDCNENWDISWHYGLVVQNLKFAVCSYKI